MLSPAKSRTRRTESLAGKLLLSSALVAVSLAYGAWQRHQAAGPAIAIAPAPMPSAPKSVLPAQPIEAAPAPAAPAQPDGAPDASMVAKEAIAPKPAIIAKAASAPRTDAPVVTPPAPPLQEAALPPPDPQAAPQMRLPSDDVSPPIALATGTPAPGLMPPIPAGAGTHLLDGDYVSDRHQLEWGDLKVKISVHGGQITGVQILQYPDHRSRSLDLSLMAGPILESEVIKTQQVQVNAVSSATDTSYAFQDTIANVIIKAARE